MAVSIERQIACVEREIALRRRAYPRWVQAGRMTEHQADREVAEMEAVLATLRGLRAELEPVIL
jgi:hypothetical protein